MIVVDSHGRDVDVLAVNTLVIAGMTVIETI